MAYAFTLHAGASLIGPHARVSTVHAYVSGDPETLARALGLRPFELDDSARTLYHAGAVFVSNYLVTLHAAATALFESAGAPPEALEPLMRRTIENDFELTGPISRGDWATVEAHRAAIRAARPELEELYETLADATAVIAR